MTVVYWIQSNKPWKHYVSHRVKEIRQLTNQNCWRHCPGALNPADLLSRRITGKELTSSSMWWNGPAFLQLDEEKWPLTEKCSDMDEAVQSELTRSSVATSHVLTNPSNTTNDPPKLDQIIDIERFSTLKSLLNTTAYILRFVNHVRRRDNALIQSDVCQTSVQLNAAEIRNAEMYWIRSIRAAQFLPEIQFLVTAKPPQPIRVLQLRLKFDENHVLRCQGRLGKSSLSLNCNSPILWPPIH